MHKVKNNKTGFTLIELLVVLAIIGLLSSVVFANVSGARVKAKIAVSNQIARQYDQALQQYFSDHGSYPPINLACLGAVGADSCITFGASVLPSAALNAALQPYMSSFPKADTGPQYLDGNHSGVVYDCTSYEPGVGGYECYLLWVEPWTTCKYGETNYTGGNGSSLCDIAFIAPRP